MTPCADSEPGKMSLRDSLTPRVNLHLCLLPHGNKLLLQCSRSAPHSFFLNRKQKIVVRSIPLPPLVSHKKQVVSWSISPLHLLLHVCLPQSLVSNWNRKNCCNVYPPSSTFLTHKTQVVAKSTPLTCLTWKQVVARSTIIACLTRKQVVARSTPLTCLTLKQVVARSTHPLVSHGNKLLLGLPHPLVSHGNKLLLGLPTHLSHTGTSCY